MADQYTTAAMYGNAEPDPSNSPPSEWLGEVDNTDDVKGLVARMATGSLNRQDDFSRVMGELGNTKDPVSLHRQFVETTGGPVPNVPVTNPVQPAVPADIADQPAAPIDQVDTAQTATAEEAGTRPSQEENA